MEVAICRVENPNSETQCSCNLICQLTQHQIPIIKDIPPSLAKPVEEKTILDEAKALVYGDRNKAYKHPIDNFNNIADLWNGYMHIKWRSSNGTPFPLEATDIALLNVLQKVARLACNNTHHDSIVDIAGYAATIERLITKQ